MNNLEKLLKQSKARSTKKQLDQIQEVLNFYKKYSKIINKAVKNTSKTKQKSQLKRIR